MAIDNFENRGRGSDERLKARRYAFTMILTAIAACVAKSETSLFMSSATEYTPLPPSNPITGHSIPLISLLARANHHDSHFLSPLAQLDKAIGLNYIGKEEQGHEFKCAAQPGQCPRSEFCAKYRPIDFD